MGSTKLTRDELAQRIQVGRYEIAYKAEVKAFVDQRLEKVTAAIDAQIDEEVSAERKVRRAEIDVLNEELGKLHSRINELELTRWARFKRWAAEKLEELVWAVCSVDEAAAADHHAALRQYDERAQSLACDVPPEGWWCSRGRGHDGPCAAHPRTEGPDDLASTPALEEAIAMMRSYPPELLIVDQSDPIAAARAGVAFMATNYKPLGDPEE